MNVPLKIVVVGPPCSGKTTLAQAIASRLAIPYLGFHDLCIDEAERHTALGQLWLRSALDNGPFELGLANSIMRPHLLRCESFVLEGYPKRDDELRAFLELCAPLDAVVEITANEALLLERAAQRLLCQQCRRPFLQTSTQDCIVCGGRGTVRADDSGDLFPARLADFFVYGPPLVRALERRAERSLQVEAGALAKSVEQYTTKLENELEHMRSRSEQRDKGP